MMNKLLIVLASISLSGCFGIGQHVQPIKTEYKVVMPESKYFVCDVVKLPDPKKLTDEEVSLLINDLVKANRICSNNMTGIKTYLQTAQDVLEKRQ
jgi:hypothetical protein